ncbi:ferredoxin [Campylobacter sputorum subsp. bubulus]|uniref:Ferredoxin n=1 Tax=Campylobacter sputorum subsp. sputorum TaxID=32024 RepID=A0A381DKN3_9BACT|nr:YfhL family 4Fe-4S dicluster ferredoxin [Campylobacter sputorum]ASM34566.1 ferredoxin [Campylobacter sputorum aubsp. sputorum RM3237]ASM36195.1 ferredoxin [Campylobacter sputorum bv. faecalis CCUG 20703]ASM37875.1 ferredoxin [Campylobacter sputorum bv. paraureolyticus LMG 11764]KAB0580789.1 YfhL family 4Fe-4S dicluster ferredoxin [Campylobacter sputorum subsp. sputorum]MDY6121020.1 YfhL family 4Fe-4S dicluster ferredoxin [Campylobacter sputorum]
MALMITNDCISCDACREECPDDAIFEDSPIYIIDPDRCSECIGDYAEPACIVVCPTDCIILDPDNIETAEELRLKHEQSSEV